MKLSLKNRFSDTLPSFASIFLILLILAFDQISKNFVQGKFNVVCNRGLAFGIGEGAVIVPLICLLTILIVLKKEKRSFGVLSFSFILGGGISNVLDRIFFGCVRDFINLGFWPSFNLADVAISVGVIVLILNIRGSTPNKGRTPKVNG